MSKTLLRSTDVNNKKRVGAVRASPNPHHVVIARPDLSGRDLPDISQAGNLIFVAVER